MDDGRHKAKKIFDELLASHTYHRFLPLRTKELVGNLHELRMRVEKIPPAIFAIAMTRFVHHVQFVPTI